jgi:hypothetical protein
VYLLTKPKTCFSHRTKILFDRILAHFSQVRIKESREADLEAQLLADRRALLEARAAAEAAQSELHMLRLSHSRASGNARLECGARDTSSGPERGPYSQAAHERPREQEGGRLNGSERLEGSGAHRAFNNEAASRLEPVHHYGAERQHLEPHSTSDRVTAAMAAAQAAIAERKALIEIARQETSPLAKQTPKTLAGETPASKPPGLPRPESGRGARMEPIHTGLRETSGMAIGTSGMVEARGGFHNPSESSAVDASVSLGDWGRGDSRGVGASVNSRPHAGVPQGDRRLPAWAESSELQQGGQNDPGRPPPSASRAPRMVPSRFNVAVGGPSIGTPLRVKQAGGKPQGLQPGYVQTLGFGEDERRGSVYRTGPNLGNGPMNPVSNTFMEERRESVYRAPGVEAYSMGGVRAEDLGDERSGSRGSSVATKQGDVFDASRAPLAGLKPNRVDSGPGLPPPVVEAKLKGARTAFSKVSSGGMVNGAQRVRNGGQVRKQFIATQAAAIAAQTNKPVELVLREKMWQ